MKINECKKNLIVTSIYSGKPDYVITKVNRKTVSVKVIPTKGLITDYDNVYDLVDPAYLKIKRSLNNEA